MDFMAVFYQTAAAWESGIFRKAWPPTPGGSFECGMEIGKNR
jgi:hypothetical protein